MRPTVQVARTEQRGIAALRVAHDLVLESAPEAEPERRAQYAQRYRNAKDEEELDWVASQVSQREHEPKRNRRGPPAQRNRRPLSYRNTVERSPLGHARRCSHGERQETRGQPVGEVARMGLEVRQVKASV